MGRKKKDNDQESLSEFQDTSKTGRTDAVDVNSEGITLTISGSAEAIANKLKKAADRANRKPIEVTSAELVDQMFCNYKYQHTVGPDTVNKVSCKSEVPVHHDLVAAFRRLDAHLAVICEEVDVKLIGDINDIDHLPTSEKINQFEVIKFAIDGPEESMTVVLTGLKELSTGEAIKLETPKINIDASYPFAENLASTVQDLVSEVEQYMRGEKQAESPQLEMEFVGDEKYAEEDV